jgi:hypothetical protein
VFVNREIAIGFRMTFVIPNLQDSASPRATQPIRVVVGRAAALSLFAGEARGRVKQNLQNRIGFTALFCATIRSIFFVKGTHHE